MASAALASTPTPTPTANVLLARIQWRNGTFIKAMHRDNIGDVYLTRHRDTDTLRICKFPWDNERSSMKDFRAERRALQHMQQRRFFNDPRRAHVAAMLEIDRISVSPGGGDASGGAKRNAAKKINARAFETDALFLEFYAGNDLFKTCLDRGDRLTMTQIREIVRQLVAALGFIHDAGVMHLDLKAENVCFATPWRPRDTRKPAAAASAAPASAAPGGVPRVVLIDFGLSEMTAEPTDEKIGTDVCLAPEVVSGRMHTPAIDMWCLGILMYEIAMVNHDAVEDYDGEITSYHDLDIKSRWLRMALGADGVDLLKSLLQQSPRNRPTCAQVAAHPYLSRNVHTYASDSDDDDDTSDNDTSDEYSRGSGSGSDDDDSD